MKKLTRRDSLSSGAAAFAMAVTFNGSVKAEAVQKVEKICIDMQTRDDGMYALWLHADGRRSETKIFHIVSIPAEK